MNLFKAKVVSTGDGKYVVRRFQFPIGYVFIDKTDGYEWFSKGVAMKYCKVDTLEEARRIRDNVNMKWKVVE